MPRKVLPPSVLLCVNKRAKLLFFGGLASIQTKFSFRVAKQKLKSLHRHWINLGRKFYSKPGASNHFMTCGLQLPKFPSQAG